MGKLVDIILPGAKMAMGYSEALLNGIAAKDFARLPKGINTNHPAFVYGHLSVYPDKIMPEIGLARLSKPDHAKWVELFDAGKECRDDPSGTIYPSMEAIVSRYRERYAALVEALPSVDESLLWAMNPNEKARDRLPTQGARLNFYLNGHTQMHLGQVSAWRRIMGMPSAM